MSILERERTTEETAATRGAAFLDEHRTDHWRQKIDVDRLDIGSECDCVLGQLYGGDWVKGLKALGLSGQDNYRYWRTRDLGFNTVTLNTPALTQAWKDLLGS